MFILRYLWEKDMWHELFLTICGFFYKILHIFVMSLILYNNILCSPIRYRVMSYVNLCFGVLFVEKTHQFFLEKRNCKSI